MGRTPTGKTRERVFCFMREQLLTGTPPTVREVQQAFGFRSVGTAREHLESLVQGGQLYKAGGRHRGFRLARQPTTHPTRLVPLLGRVQAGALTTAVQETEDYLVVQSGFSAEELFALRVRGNSMVPDMLPGDIVIVRKQASANHGDIVVALIDDEATVKRFRLLHGRVELHAANPQYEPIVPPPDKLILLGKAVELRRHLAAP